MCGIAGFIHCGSENQLEAATSILAHRGPDAQGIKWFSEHNSGLGHRRLSIIDLSPAGTQPLYHQASNSWIVFNGELFNFRDIRKELELLGHQFFTATDTEVVAAAYLQWGRQCLQYFNGMFAFAILHEDSGNVFIARDRMGIKPLYYHTKPGKLIFASEIKAILCCQDYQAEPDLFALHTPAHYQIGPNTGFKDILKLPPASYLEMNAGELRISRYWEIIPGEAGPLTADIEEKLDTLLKDSIRLQMISDVPVGSLLSGGLDSSLISVLMQSQMQRQLSTLTIRFSEEDRRKQGNVDDAWYAARLAKEFGFSHTEITIEADIAGLLPKMIWHMDEPLADPAAINTFLIARKAREMGIYVLLSGIGADEVYGGYRSQYACLKAGEYQRRIPASLRTLLERSLSMLPEGNLKQIRWAKRFSEIASLPPFERYIRAYNSALSPELYNELFVNAGDWQQSLYIKTQKKSFEAAENTSYLGRMCLNDSRFYLPDHNLTYTDKSAMAAGVETRPPLIDHRLVELMFSLPPEYRIKGKEQKVLLKKVAARHLPRWIIDRPKAPFSAPMRSWLKGDLSEMVNDVLSEGNLKRRGFYNPTKVAELIKQNKAGKHDHSQLIWRMMVNELWFMTFFDKKSFENI